MARRKSISKQSDEKSVAKQPVTPSKSLHSYIDLDMPTMPSAKGSLYVIGKNESGQLGLGSVKIAEQNTLIPVTSTEAIVDVKAGGKHSVVLNKNGDVFTFGSNDDYALGRPIDKDASSPKKVTLPGKTVRISAGEAHSACLLEDGRVFAWGTFKDSIRSIGLTSDGEKKTVPTEILPNIVAVDIASGSNHLVILAKNGKVFTLGCGEHGQLGRVSVEVGNGQSRRGNVPILTPEFITKRNHQVIATAIWATPRGTFYCEKVSNIVYGCGLNNYHQLGYENLKKQTDFETHPVETSLKNVKSIAGGENFTIVLTKDNSVYSIGSCKDGKLGLGKVNEDVKKLTLVEGLDQIVIVGIACGVKNYAFNYDGVAYEWGFEDIDKPQIIQNDQIFQAIDSNASHSLFIMASGNKKTSKVGKENQVTKTKAAPKSKKNVKVLKDSNINESTDDEKSFIVDVPVEKEDEKESEVKEQAMETDDNASGSPTMKSEINKRGRKRQASPDADDEPVAKKEAKMDEQKPTDVKEDEMQMETDDENSVDDNASNASGSPAKKMAKVGNKRGIKKQQASPVVEEEPVAKKDDEKQSEGKEDEMQMETDDKNSVDDNASNASGSPTKKKAKGGNKKGKKRRN